MADLQQILSETIEPALALLPARMATDKARVMLLAIGLQESRFEHTHQIGGPAHSWWQFEKGGGVKGVMNHASSYAHARMLCEECSVAFDRAALFNAMEHDQVLAAGMARLLLWTDPRPMPTIGDSAGAWAYYLRNWRPGKPKPQTWQKLYEQAVFAVADMRAAA